MVDDLLEMRTEYELLVASTDRIEQRVDTIKPPMDRMAQRFRARALANGLQQIGARIESLQKRLAELD